MVKIATAFFAGQDSDTMVTAAIDLQCVFPSPLPVFEVFYKWVAAIHEGNTYMYGIHTTPHPSHPTGTQHDIQFSLSDLN